MMKDSSRIRGTNPFTEQAARRLRRNMTSAEVRLWGALCRRQLAGLRFRSQHPVGPFIVDFYCPACKLVVEVDGGVHEHQQEYDAARTEHIESYGYRVIRFTNNEVFTDLARVLEAIANAAAVNKPNDEA